MHITTPKKMVKEGQESLDKSLDTLEESRGLMTARDIAQLHHQYLRLDEEGHRLQQGTSFFKVVPRTIKVSKWLKEVKVLGESVVEKSKRARNHKFLQESVDTIVTELENMDLDPSLHCAEFHMDKYSLDQRKKLFEKFIADLTLDEGKYQAICNSEDREVAKDLVGYIDHVMPEIASEPAYSHLRRRCINMMKKLCENHAIYPSSFVVPRADVHKVGPRISDGASADVWEGSYGDVRVALKEYRQTANGAIKPSLLKTFCREVAIWKYLNHPNVTSCYGVLGQKAPLCLISRWMVNGTLDSYLKSHPDARRLDLVRDIIAGLQYIHEMGLVHGDLKSLNILVDEKGVACLADFGFAAFCHNEHTGFISNSSTKGLTMRWAAPEMLNPELFGLSEACPTKECDVYALSMVMWEVFTGTVPFPHLSLSKIPYRVPANERPPRPLQALELGLTSDVWDIMERCWQHDPTKRPIISEIRRIWDEILRSPEVASIEARKV